MYDEIADCANPASSMFEIDTELQPQRRIKNAVAICPAAGHGLKWTKCPAVRNFHIISAERLFNLLVGIGCFFRNIERVQKQC